MLSKQNMRHTHVLLLRHGQSTYNALGLYQGSSDYPCLTELGRQQAKNVAKFLQDYHFDGIYVSPLKRSQETSQIIAQYLEPPPFLQTISALRETELPLWQGLSPEQVKAQFPQDYWQWKQLPHQFRMKLPAEWSLTANTPSHSCLAVAENHAYCQPAVDLYQRVYQVWETILPRHVGKNILIISHSGTNKGLISTALGISSAYYHSFEQVNCAMNLLTFRDGTLTSSQLETLNHSTVQPTLPPVKTGGQRLLFIPNESKSPQFLAKLAELLSKENIDFSISDHQDRSYYITQQILQSHPETVQLQVFRENLSPRWQKCLKQSNLGYQTKLLTGLVVTSAATIQDFLGQMLGMSSSECWRLAIHAATVSVLYIPSTGELPRLQGLNLSLSR